MSDTPETGTESGAESPQYSPEELASKGQQGDTGRADVNLDLVLTADLQFFNRFSDHPAYSSFPIVSFAGV